MNGNSRLERFWNVECQKAWTPFTHRGQLVSLNPLTFPELWQRAASLPPKSVLTYWGFWVDAAELPHEEMSGRAVIQSRPSQGTQVILETPPPGRKNGS